MKLSLIVPAYNEEKVIENTLLNYMEYFRNRNPSLEIIPVTDGTDKTGDIVKQMAKKYKMIKPKVYKHRLGKGGGVLKGFKAATGDIIGFVDADQSTKPDAFYKLVKAIKNHDVVIASRHLPGAVILQDRSFLQRIGSRGFNLLVKILLRLNFRDTQCGAKLFRREVVDKILNSNMTKDDWAFDVELLYIAKTSGFNIKEIPTIWKHRAKDTKFKFSTNFHKIVPDMFVALLKIRRRYSNEKVQ